jgi:hypothetical protein
MLNPPCSKLLLLVAVGVDITTVGASVSYVNVTELAPKLNTLCTLLAVSEARATITYCLLFAKVTLASVQLVVEPDAGI